MSIVVLKCPGCGADLELDGGREFGFCSFCGTKILIKKDTPVSSLDGQISNLKPLMEANYRSGDILEAHKYASQIVKINGADADTWYIFGIGEIFLDPDRPLDGMKYMFKNYEIMSGKTVDIEAVKEECRKYALLYSLPGFDDDEENSTKYLLSRKWMPEDVVIPSTVTAIGSRAFKDCFLESVSIPSSVRTIGEYAFDGSGLGFEPIIIPSSVETIGEYAFCGCMMESVTIPPSVKVIGDNAFSCCFYLTSVTIPSSVETIGDHAFFGCKSLRDVSLPNSVKVAKNAFEETPYGSLKSKVLRGLFGKK